MDARDVDSLADQTRQLLIDIVTKEKEPDIVGMENISVLYSTDANIQVYTFWYNLV